MQAQNLIAIQADILEKLQPETDSTLFIASEICKKGYKTFFYTPEKLSLVDNKLYTTGRYIHVEYTDFSSKYSVQTDEHEICLNQAKAVLIRQNPPFNMDYLTSLYLLSLITKEVLVLNSPFGLSLNPEKILPLYYPQLIPPTMIVSSMYEGVADFIKEHNQVIVKPLYWFGGKHLELIEANNIDNAKNIIKKAILQHNYVILQKFLPKVRDGDKRIFLINGEPVAAIKRVPKAEGFLTNLTAGGTAVKTKITDKEYEICSQLSKYLQAQGIFLAGVDLIAEKLIEVNVTSPTGLITVDRLYGVNLASKIASYIDQKIQL